MSVAIGFQYEPADLGDAPGYGAAAWMAASRALSGQRRKPAGAEARALRDPAGLCRRIGLPTACGAWGPGTLLWWSEQESGRVCAFGNGRDSAFLLLDQVTGAWRLTVHLQDGRSVTQQGRGLAALVATRLGVEPAEAETMLAEWFPSRPEGV